MNNKFIILTGISFVSLIILITFSKHRKEKYKHHRVNGSYGIQRRNNRNALQNGNKHEVAVRETQELIHQT